MSNIKSETVTTPVTRETYWATLDALTKARQIEDEKYAAIERGEPGAREAMAAWWRVAEPRWRDLEAMLQRAEAEDWVRAIVWLDLWRTARKAGKAPGSLDVLTGGVETREAGTSRRGEATAPRQMGILDPRRIEIAGSV